MKRTKHRDRLDWFLFGFWSCLSIFQPLSDQVPNSVWIGPWKSSLGFSNPSSTSSSRHGKMNQSRSLPQEFRWTHLLWQRSTNQFLHICSGQLACQSPRLLWGSSQDSWSFLCPYWHSSLLWSLPSQSCIEAFCCRPGFEQGSSCLRLILDSTSLGYEVQEEACTEPIE